MGADAAASLAQLGLHLSSALHYMHGKGYLHLDIKPGNIVVESGIARVIDLSLARPPGTYRQGVGTPAYLSPEQARGGALSPASDIWGIGVTLYEAGTFKTAFDPSGRRESAFVGQGGYLQLRRRARPLGRLRPGLPQELTTIVERCLDPEPGERPTLSELRATLMTLIEPSPQTEAWRLAMAS